MFLHFQIYSRNDIYFITKNILCVWVCLKTVKNHTSHAFARELDTNAPAAEQIKKWHKKLNEEGYLCRAKRSGQPQELERIKTF